MRACAALLITAALGTAPAVSQETMSYQERLQRLDTTLADIRQNESLMQAAANESYRDLRGRTAFEDIRQWVFPDKLLDEISGLTEKARASAPGRDDVSLDRADSLMYDALVKSEELRAYWLAVPQISWRDRWAAFARANQLNSVEFDPALLSEVRLLLAALDSGRFSNATVHTNRVDQLLGTAMSKSAAEVIRKLDPRDIVFVDRSTPCPVDNEKGDTASARLAVAADPEAWYPASAKDRGETGSIVVRGRIAASNCGTAFAVLVSSGYPELDAAALKVAEESRYLAAVKAGKPVASELTFKVRFVLKEEDE